MSMMSKMLLNDVWMDAEQFFQLRQDTSLGGVPQGAYADVTGATGIAPSEAGPPKAKFPNNSRRRRLRNRF